MPQPRPSHGDSSTYCRGCDYDIGGLDDEDVCPECGLGVRASRASNRIATLGAAHLKRLGWGSIIVSSADVALVVCVLLGLAYPSVVPLFTVPAAGASVVAGWTLARLLGVWLLTASRGGAAGAGSGGDPGHVRLAHAALVVAVGTAVVTGVIDRRVSLFYSIALLVALVLGGLSYAALARFMRWLGRESNDGRLMRRATSIRSMALLSLFGGALYFGIIILLVRSGLAHWAQTYSDIMSPLLGLFVVLFMILLLYEAFVFARCAKRAQSMAKGR